MSPQKLYPEAFIECRLGGYRYPTGFSTDGRFTHVSHLGTRFHFRYFATLRRPRHFLAIVLTFFGYHRPAATTPFPTPEEQNTLNLTPSTSPSERAPARPFSFDSRSSELQDRGLPSTEALFWDPSPYLDPFTAHHPSSSTDTNAVSSITSWEPTPIDHDLGNWWASQGA
jgi:hypothetical protein